MPVPPMLQREVIDELMVTPGMPAALHARSTGGTVADWLGPTGRHHPRDVAEADLTVFKAELQQAQDLLYANGTRALLVVLQGLDAAGKDGTIKHVMSGVNPQSCHVASFKQPSAVELAHDFLWRCVLALPERGHIGIFNRSYYEEVLVCRVHPDLLHAQRLPDDPMMTGTRSPGTEGDVAEGDVAEGNGPHGNGPHGARLTGARPAGGWPDDAFWQARFEDINAFERHLVRSGTHLVKVYLHLSPDEQRRRLMDRLDDPGKHWKFSAADLAERQRFAEYRQAYEAAITATSTTWAPWYVVPADHKFALRALVGGIIADVVHQLDLRPPAVTAEQDRAIRAARRALTAEG